MNKKVAVITGAGSGLGASLARKLSQLGFHVCLLGRTVERLQQTAKSIEGESSIYVLDISNKKDVADVFHLIKTEIGLIDVLMNNAGTGAFDLAENLGEDAVNQMIDINLKGTIFCTQEVLPDMKQRNEGMIANIVSTAGLEGKVKESVYCASKFGVRGFSESLSLELKDTQVKVFSAYMGGMKTEFWDGIISKDQIKHLIEADDVAKIIVDNIKPYRNLVVQDVVIKNKI